MHFSMDHLHVLATIQWIACFIIGIIQIVAYFHFKSMDRLHVIRKRFPGIVRTEAVVLILVLFLVFPLIFKDQMNIVDHCIAHGHSVAFCQAVRQFIDILAVVTRPMIYLLIFLEAARLWLIYFNLNLLRATLNEKWASNITSTFALNDYYLANKHKWGNEKWVVRRVGIVWFFTSLILVGKGLYVNYRLEGHQLYVYTELTNMIWQCIPLAFIGYIFLYFKTPNTEMNDCLMLGYEFRGNCKLLAVSAVGYTTSGVLVALGFEFYCIPTMTLFFSMTAPSLFSTVWIPMKIRRSKQWDQELIVDSINLTQGPFKEGMTAIRQRRQSVAEAVNKLFQDEQKLDSFIAWMTREFSVEAILSFIELHQFKESLIEQLEQQNGSGDLKQEFDTGHRYAFHERIPKSSIVFNVTANDLKAEPTEIIFNDGTTDNQDNGGNAAKKTASVGALDTIKEEGSDSVTIEIETDGSGTGTATGTAPTYTGSATPTTLTDERDRKPLDSASSHDDVQVGLEDEELELFKKKARLLYHKYLKVDALMEINISYELRQRFVVLDEMNYRTATAMDLMMMYDDVLVEMKMFIEQSYMRLVSEVSSRQRQKAAKKEKKNGK